ncbi:thiazole biosynthesis adenylyltransferase ThiF [Halobacillus andaensis]|uniref:Thiazole biosynthesis adenylyltransferase ThiF n=1 Tax=Halobacillus andaensis TaxID=1176239 RepID=A0A917BD62_HALAA|nr:thiazole biosynthesis adenylyltransferase ThiF [Halobacillus andaensis]MBP2006303.1 molybdopterin/thiamine biosynthesis adenylyltransferase [Halobacillus andaensis]GGF34128.1 thiazole biosynthesis adenylyltransferase ThiF [Halobacillus andaensis]
MSFDRYSRQERFKPIGVQGQEKLISKHVLVIGAGALGTSSAEQLVRGGVGKLTIVDRDYVEWSNLQRQQLFTEKDAKQRIPKAKAAESKLKEINSEVQIKGHIMDVQREELERLIDGVDVVLDATDNFDTRMLVNDVCQKHRIPWIYGGCVGSHGMSFTILPGETPCLQCLLESVPMGGATCDTVGVISPAVQMVTAHQVAEALKILVDDKEALIGKFVMFDLWNHHYTTMKVDRAKRETCPSCGVHATYPYLSPEYQTKTAVLCGRDTVQIRPPSKMVRDLDEVRMSLVDGEVEQNPFLLSYKKGDHRMIFFKDGRVLIHGTKDVTEARNLYHKIIG